MWFEPTCIIKSEKPFHSDSWHGITFVSPNLNELRAMSSVLCKKQLKKNLRPLDNRPPGDYEKERPLDDVITECVRLCKPLLTHIHCVVVTLGKHGALVCRDTSADTEFPTAHSLSLSPTRQHSLVSARHFPATAEPDGHVLESNVTGAGDR